jgi:hypothetical protein
VTRLASIVFVTGVAAAIPAGAQQPPNLSGYWGAGHAVAIDPARVALPPNTVIVPDAGAPELSTGDFGGLRPTPAALAAAKQWKPADELKADRVCVPPSIVHAMQMPFPIEIEQDAGTIVMRLEYHDLVRTIFMDGRPHPPAGAPQTRTGHSIGRWDGATLVVDTTHLSASTLTNNGLNHSDAVHVTERFWLSPDAKTLLMQQEFEDPGVLENRGARFVAWDRGTGAIQPYGCDPSFIPK